MQKNEGRASEACRSTPTTRGTGVEMDHFEMDFVTGFPRPRRGSDAIFVVIDNLSKVAHFLPVKESISAVQLAELYTARIVSLHGIPRNKL